MKILHTKITVSLKYYLISAKDMEQKSISCKLSPLALAEMVSNKNTIVNIKGFWMAFINDANKVVPDKELVKPLIVMTDCPPQLESGALSAFASEGMKFTQIEYGNTVLLHLLHYNKVVTEFDSDACKEAAVPIFNLLKQFFGVLLKECMFHVYLAPHKWVNRNAVKFYWNEEVL
jgi:hypothetical protein